MRYLNLNLAGHPPPGVKWLQAAANIFDLIYSGDGGGMVVCPGALILHLASVKDVKKRA